MTIVETAGAILRGTFGFLRHNLALVAVWGLLFAVLNFASETLLGPLEATPHLASIDPARFWSLFVPGWLLTIGGMLVLYAAVIRAVLQPHEGRAYYLRFGMDELRLFGLVVILWVVATIGLVLFAVLLGVVLVLLNGGGDRNAALPYALAAAAICVTMLFCFMVRLTAAGPLTLERRQVILGPAWTLVCGNFWPLFVATLAIWLLTAIVYLAYFAVVSPTTFYALLHPMDRAAQGAMHAVQIARANGGPLPRLIAALGGTIIGTPLFVLQSALGAVATRLLLAQQEVRTLEGSGGPWG